MACGCLLCKNEDPSSEPHHLHKATHDIYIYSPSVGRGEGRKIPAPCWPASVAKNSNSRFNKRRLFQKRRLNPVEEDTWSQLLASAHPHTSWGHFINKRSNSGPLSNPRSSSNPWSLSNDPKTSKASHCCSRLGACCYNIVGETWGSTAKHRATEKLEQAIYPASLPIPSPDSPLSLASQGQLFCLLRESQLACSAPFHHHGYFQGCCT